MEMRRGCFGLSATGFSVYLSTVRAIAQGHGSCELGGSHEARPNFSFTSYLSRQIQEPSSNFCRRSLYPKKETEKPSGAKRRPRPKAKGKGKAKAKAVAAKQEEISDEEQPRRRRRKS